MKKKYNYLMWVLIFLISPVVLSSANNVIFWGSTSSPETLDPAQAWDDTSVLFTFNIYETLIKLNPETFEIEPLLAVSWKAKNQGKMWIFKLRQGVKFHDGTDFNASSVVFSFQRQLDKNFKYRYYDFPIFEEIFRNIKSVIAVDSHTVAFALKEPFYPFLATLSSSGASIISPTAAKKYRAKFLQNPVGTGPFILKSWEMGERVVLVSNPLYWRGKPALDKFVHKHVSKYDQLHKLFRQGDIDIIDSISISRTVGLKNVQWVTIERVPTLSVNFIAFNFNNKYLQRENIRRAIRYLWEDRVLKYVFQDFVVPLNSVLPKGIPGYREILPEKKFSLSKSKDLLNKEQIDEKIKLIFLLPSNSGLQRQMIQWFSKNLKRVGIELSIQSFPNQEYLKKVEKGEFDLTISGWIVDYPDSHDLISALFNAQLQKSGFVNLSGYEDEVLRKQIDKIAIESNMVERRKMIERIIQKIDNKALCIPIYQNTSVLIYNNKRIKKVSVSPYGNISLFDIVKK